MNKDTRKQIIKKYDRLLGTKGLCDANKWLGFYFEAYESLHFEDDCDKKNYINKFLEYNKVRR